MSAPSGPAGQAVQLCGRVATASVAGRHPAPAAPGAAATLRRHLLAGLRDAHAAGESRPCGLVRTAEAAATRPLRRLLHRVLAELEEQQHRLGYCFASLRELAGGGDPGAAPAASAELRRLAQCGTPGAERDAALAAVIGRDLARAAEQAEALRITAQAAGLHLLARLLDRTAAESRAAAQEADRIAGRPAAPASA